MIRNGVEAPISRNGSGRLLRDELGLPHDTTLVGTIGDLRRKKRLEDLVWAADLLRAVRPNVHLCMVGTGAAGPRLQEFSFFVSGRRGVHFLGHRTDIGSLCSQFLCLWQASTEEGCSNALLEGMYVGCPAVASDVAGHRSIVIQGQTGFLVPVGAPAEFARRTFGMLNDPTIATRLGEQAEKHVRTMFPPEAMVREYERLYEQIRSSSGQSV